MATESIGITESLAARTSGLSILPDGLSDGPVTGGDSMNDEESIEVRSGDQATINILPDYVLLEIFHLYSEGITYARRWWWKRLTDVCRRWRDIMFASPRRLDLQLGLLDDEGQDNIIAALEHHDRILEIGIRDQNRFALERFSAVTRKPFPPLTDLRLFSTDEIGPVFLGGSTGSVLTYLTLLNIPNAGYIPPEAMATCLAALPSLATLSIGFQSPQSRPDRIVLPPPTRAVLPALTVFAFKGVSEYLEALVARIDTPHLFSLQIHLFMNLMFRFPQLHKFITRTERTRPHNPAEITFSSSEARIGLEPSSGSVRLTILCKEPDWQASSVAQVCSQLSPLLSHVEYLEIRERTPGETQRGNGIDPTQWFELFHPFPAVKSLRMYGELGPLVAQALKELRRERATEVLPALRGIFFNGPSLSGSIRKGLQPFIVARQHSDHPVDAHWE
ncbi:hypothetical protein BJV74DRAFT_953485 [Russula compacta]|nr:hypothetical protein BJV74DRAFT_953485 [Russula compacta]